MRFRVGWIVANGVIMDGYLGVYALMQHADSFRLSAWLGQALDLAESGWIWHPFGIHSRPGQTCHSIVSPQWLTNHLTGVQRPMVD